MNVHVKKYIDVLKEPFIKLAYDKDYLIKLWINLYVTNDEGEKSLKETKLVYEKNTKKINIVISVILILCCVIMYLIRLLNPDKSLRIFLMIYFVVFFVCLILHIIGIVKVRIYRHFGWLEYRRLKWNELNLKHRKITIEEIKIVRESIRVIEDDELYFLSIYMFKRTDWIKTTSLSMFEKLGIFGLGTIVSTVLSERIKELLVQIGEETIIKIVLNTILFAFIIWIFMKLYEWFNCIKKKQEIEELLPKLIMDEIKLREIQKLNSVLIDETL